MTFKPLLKQGRTVSQEATVTVGKELSGLSLSVKTYEHLGQPGAVILSYDEDQGLLALDPANEEDTGAYTVSRKGKGTSSNYVSAGRVLKDNDVIPGMGRGRRYAAETVICADGQPRVIVDLGSSYTEVGR